MVQRRRAPTQKQEQNKTKKKGREKERKKKPLTSTHLLRAKSNPHPCTKSFYKKKLECLIRAAGSMDNTQKGTLYIYSFVIIKQHNPRYKTYLNHMPHTTPSFPRKDWGHNFYKSERTQELIKRELSCPKKSGICLECCCTCYGHCACKSKIIYRELCNKHIILPCYLRNLHPIMIINLVLFVSQISKFFKQAF